MTYSVRRRRFREILAGDVCVRPASVFDPLSARIAVDLGFEAGMFAGSVASMTVLGAPDLVVLTLTEFAEQIRRMMRATDLSLLVDADHGYGNALSVMRTVAELEASGVSALTIEDTELPPRFGSGGEARLLALDEGLGKIHAAVEARTDPELVVVGRTSAVALAGLDEGIRRVEAYAGTGVDALFLVGVKTRDELEAIRAAVDLPLLLGGTGDALSDVDYLTSQGVRVALQGHAPFMAAVQAVHDTLAALRAGVSPKDLPGQPDPELIERLTRAEAYDEWSTRFLN